jgi:hypothetical protein
VEESSATHTHSHTHSDPKKQGADREEHDFFSSIGESGGETEGGEEDRKQGRRSVLVCVYICRVLLKKGEI